TRRAHSRWNHRVSDRFAHALRSRRSTLPLVVELHYSCHNRHRRVFHFRHRKRRARPAVAGEGGKGNAYWKNRDGADANRFAQRQNIRRRRILERDQRCPDRKRRRRRDRGCPRINHQIKKEGWLRTAEARQILTSLPRENLALTIAVLFPI